MKKKPPTARFEPGVFGSVVGALPIELLRIMSIREYLI